MKGRGRLSEFLSAQSIDTVPQVPLGAFFSIAAPEQDAELRFENPTLPTGLSLCVRLCLGRVAGIQKESFFTPGSQNRPAPLQVINCIKVQ